MSESHTRDSHMNKASH